MGLKPLQDALFIRPSAVSSRDFLKTCVTKHGSAFSLPSSENHNRRDLSTSRRLSFRVLGQFHRRPIPTVIILVDTLSAW